METNFSVECPYCGENIWMEFYQQDGDQQEMVVDCEVCCNPILYEISFKGEDYNLRVERAQ